MILLVIGAALTLGMVGYSAGLTRRRSLLSAAVLVVVLGAVLTLVVDLDRPRDGFLQVSQQPLIDLQRADRPPVTTKRAAATVGTARSGYQATRWSGVQAADYVTASGPRIRVDEDVDEGGPGSSLRQARSSASG